MSIQVDKTIVREMIAHDEADPPVNCPKCGAKLVQEYGPYQVATRSGRRLTDSFILSGEFGYLCSQCPTAVIHMPDLTNMLYGFPTKPGWRRGSEFAVIGLIDFDAIPPEKAHIPIDKLDPFPLVPFTSVNKNEPRQLRKRPRKPKPKRKK